MASSSIINNNSDGKKHSANAEYIRKLRQRRVYRLVADKREGEGPPEEAERTQLEELGAKGWFTRGYLPHRDQPGILQTITFRLADALPASRRREWEALLEIEEERERRRKIEAYLDCGYGECYLRQPASAELVEQALLHQDGRQYRLCAWVIMPNHVHVIIEIWLATLPAIVKSWKAYTARMANRHLDREGSFWQAEYWDRWVRGEAHFWRALRYVENNPAKAGLVRDPAAWPYSSAHPKWQWDTAENRFTRYRGAELIHPNNNASLKAQPT